MSTSSQTHELIQASKGRLTKEMVQAAKEYISMFDQSAILGHGEYTWQGILQRFGSRPDEEVVWRQMTLALIGILASIFVLSVITDYKPF